MNTISRGKVLRARALLGDYPSSRAIKSGQVRSPLVALEYADVKTPNRAFKSVVRELAFDVAELAIVTFLQAKALGRPLVLMPVRVGSARFQHQCLVYNAERGALSPSQLAGRRIGARAYAQTTVTWIRGFLQHDYGVDPKSVRWVTFEDAHVAEFRDPAWSERAPEGADIMAMLLAGEIDAAIIGNELPGDERVRSLIPDPVSAAMDWSQRNKAVPINHMMVVQASVSKEHPEAVRELYRIMKESRKAGPPAPDTGFDMAPYGVEGNRSALQLAIDYSNEQGLLARQLTVDELFDDVTRAVN